MNILYAEDDKFLRDLTTKLLVNHGHVVEAVASAIELTDRLLVAETVAYDVVVTDNSMPKFGDGLSVLRYIRSDERLASLPVIVLSGDNIRNEVEESEGIYFEKGRSLDLFLKKLTEIATH